MTIVNMTSNTFAAPYGSTDWSINGTVNSDTITGSGGYDIIHGNGGNDTIYGSGDNYSTSSDYLYGDEGDDVIWAGRPAHDVGSNAVGFLYGGDGNDTLYSAPCGSIGTNTLLNQLNGGLGADQLYTDYFNYVRSTWSSNGTIFAYDAATDSTVTANPTNGTGADTIHDFRTGIDGLDLRFDFNTTDSVYTAPVYSATGGSNPGLGQYSFTTDSVNHTMTLWGHTGGTATSGADFKIVFVGITGGVIPALTSSDVVTSP